MQKSYNLMEFRKDSAKFVGEPAEALVVPEVDADFRAFGQAMKNPVYCTSGPGGVPQPRVRIFQRSGVKNTRAFTNLRDVMKAIQMYTSLPVEVFTVNATTSIADQVRYFNQWDILITPHGRYVTPFPSASHYHIRLSCNRAKLLPASVTWPMAYSL